MRKFCLLVLFSTLFAHEGVEYRKMTTKVPQVIHILQVDPKKAPITAARALDEGVGRESVGSLCKRKEAIGGANGSFFTFNGNFDGVSVGTLKIAGRYYSLSNEAGSAIAWSDGGTKVLADRFTTSITLDGKQINGINRQRKEEETLLFFPWFHRTTLTDPGGMEIEVIEDEITKRGPANSSVIPPKGFIISSADPTYSFPVGHKVGYEIKINSLSKKTAPKQWDEAEYIVSGYPLMIRDGKMLEKYTEEYGPVDYAPHAFIHQRHARTAIGVLKNGDWIFVVVDKDPPKSEGMNIPELAKLMTDLHCEIAINVDGGRSVSLVLDGKYMSTPIDNEESLYGTRRKRRVGDAFLIGAKQPEQRQAPSAPK